MRDEVAKGLTAAEALPVGTTRIDAGGYFKYTPALTQAGGYLDVSSHLGANLAAFGRASAGYTYSPAGRSHFGATGIFGIRGIF